MRKLFEFKCTDCQEIFEELTEYKQESVCPVCGQEATKIISSPRVSLEGYSGSFPGAAITWEKKHKSSIAKQED